MPVRRYLVRRLLQIPLLLLIVSFLSFSIMHLAPGGPENIIFAGDPSAQFDPQAAERLREKWGLNDPIHVQYFRWVKNVVTGDMGRSFYYRKPVATAIAERLPNTLKLQAVVIFFTYLIAIPLGIYTAVRQYSVADYVATTFSFLGTAMPSFWVGTMLIFLVALKSKGLIPTSGIANYRITLETHGLWAVLVDRARYMLLPTLTLVTGSLAGLMRYVRNSMLEVLKEDYIRTARAKGLSERVVIYRHAFRNALIPVVTLSSGILVGLFSGSVVTEQVFAWPGLGTLSVEAVNNRDYQVVMAFLLVGAVLSIIGNLLVDIIYVFVDPRIKYD
ncbi:MAG: ABC transporter permease [Bacillota bacterium]